MKNTNALISDDEVVFTSERTKRTSIVPRRLTPETPGTGWEFGYRLKQLGVPVETAPGDADAAGTVYLVPLCCAELYFDRHRQGSKLGAVSLEVVARLAADVYFAELTACSERRVFTVRGSDSHIIALMKRLQTAGHRGYPGRNGSTLYKLTKAEATAFGFQWE